MEEKDKKTNQLKNFDWEAFENGSYPTITKEELDKAYEATLNKVSPHQIVDGTIISIDKDEVVVNIGYKTDGIIAASEFAYNPDLKIGDIVKVYIVKYNNKIVLSHNIAIGVKNEINDMDDEEIINEDNYYDNCEEDEYNIEEDGDEYIPDKSQMKYTHGVFSPCPYCGSEYIHAYIDGTAKCDKCKRWFCYQI
jgi:transcriptional accessory protein Tex/SPT6